ncbi:hypothetical protein LTS18_008114, partial [Coniosporium uncinatum]
RKASGNSSQNPKRHRASTAPSPLDAITSTDDSPCHPRPHRPPGPPSPPPTRDITADEALARSFELQYSIERHNYIAEHNVRAEREFTKNLDVRDAMDFARREDERQQEPSRALARCLREEENRRKGDGGAVVEGEVDPLKGVCTLIAEIWLGEGSGDSGEGELMPLRSEQMVACMY